MIHGGGHVMLSRKDIRPLQTELLLDNGLLPISIDHRLCPELDLIKGPMTDVCSALEWARNVLPTLELERSDIQADGTKVVVIGWSTGGTLAMSMGWTAPARGIQPPEAILVFYCPTDYQAEWWTRSHFPWGTSQADADRPYDIWETIRDTPITGFNIASARAIGGWMSTSDPRARIPLHMNWTAQTLPILLSATTSHQKALRRKKEEAAAVPLAPLNGHSRLAFPTKAEIAPISPRAQIVSGAYRAPTYIIHGTADDFIPWKESQDTYAALVERGIPAGLSIVEGGGHIFEMRGIPKGDPAVGRAVLDGYRFLLERVGVDIGEYGKGREKW
jgi:acetyl esterase/lipase